MAHDRNICGFTSGRRCDRGTREAKRRATGLTRAQQGHIYSRPEVRNLCTGSVTSNGSGFRWKIQRATANPTATYIRLRAFMTPPINDHRGGEVVRCPEVSNRTKVQQRFERASAWLQGGVTVTITEGRGSGVPVAMMEARASPPVRMEQGDGSRKRLALGRSSASSPAITAR